jgi:flagellar basal-body rod protein FlgB
MIEGLFQSDSRQMAQVLMDKSVLRHRAIAANIANVETPGYKRVDLNPAFDSRLMSMMKSGDVEGLASFQHQLTEDRSSPAVRPDGNNVKLESEMLSLNRNAMDFEFLSKYMGKSIGRLKMAITGSTSTNI